MTSTGKHCSPRQDRQASVAHLDRTDRRALLTSTGLNNKTDRGKVSSSIDSKTQRQTSTTVVLKATTQAMLATCCAYATSMEANQVLAMLEVHSAPPLHLFGCCHVALLVAGNHDLACLHPFASDRSCCRRCSTCHTQKCAVAILGHAPQVQQCACQRHTTALCKMCLQHMTYDTHTDSQGMFRRLSAHLTNGLFCSYTPRIQGNLSLCGHTDVDMSSIHPVTQPVGHTMLTSQTLPNRMQNHYKTKLDYSPLKSTSAEQPQFYQHHGDPQ